MAKVEVKLLKKHYIKDRTYEAGSIVYVEEAELGMHMERTDGKSNPRRDASRGKAPAPLSRPLARTALGAPRGFVPVNPDDPALNGQIAENEGGATQESEADFEDVGGAGDAYGKAGHEAKQPGEDQEDETDDESATRSKSGVQDLDTRINDAFSALDPANDAHWTKAGKPDVDTVSKLVGATVSRKDIDKVDASFERPQE